MDDVTEREAVMELPKGSLRAFMAMTGEWQPPGKATFAWAGAEQVALRLPQFVERELVRLGGQFHPRQCYRLNAAGLAARDHLPKKDSE